MWKRKREVVAPIAANSSENILNQPIDSMDLPNTSSDNSHVVKSLFAEDTADVAASAVGIATAHQVYFSKLAKEHHLILLWRPVNAKAADRLNQNYIGKRLNLKSKSSEFGPIAGDIPSNPRLGKAIYLEEEKINYLDAVNRSLVEYSAGESDSMIRDNIAALKTEREQQDKIAKLNDAYRVTEVDKYVDGTLVYYAVDVNESILTLEPKSDSPQQKMPRFFKRVDENQYQEYDYGQSDFNGAVYHLNDTVTEVGQASHSVGESVFFRPVKILAYKRFKYDATNSCIIEDKPITADYDELACCPRNDYPFYNNTQVRTQITNALYRKLASPGGLTEEEKIEIVAELVIEHDNAKYAEEQALIDRISMGYMTDHEHALKTVENLDTEGATNHGPEVYNFYHTENFSTKPEDIYFSHLPDGSTEVFRNDDVSTAEQKICAFINNWRNDGYPIPVNPCWGWEINEVGLLETENSMKRKEAWRQVMDELQTLERKVQNIDNDLERIFDQFSIPFTPEMRVFISEFGRKFFDRAGEDFFSEYSEDQSILLQAIVQEDAVSEITKLIDQYEKEKKTLAHQRNLIQRQLQIERIRLGASLIYSKRSLTGDEGHTYDENEKLLNDKVNQYIVAHVDKIKAARIHLLKQLQVRPISELFELKATPFLGFFLDSQIMADAQRLTAQHTVQREGQSLSDNNEKSHAPLFGSKV